MPARPLLDLSRVTADTFEPLVGTTFDVIDGSPPRVLMSLRLASIERPAARGVRPPGLREPFVLTFGGPAEPVLEAQLLPLRHETLGDLALNVSPISTALGTTTYEAIFA